jgi:hypothetical protein
MSAYPRIPPHTFPRAPLAAEQEGAANRQLSRHRKSEARLIAMQKVEGSNPFSRFARKPRRGGAFFVSRQGYVAAVTS